MSLLPRSLIFACLIACGAAESGRSEDSMATSWVETIRRHADETISPKTPGGRQFWGDVHHFQGWRIQQHAFSPNYRLLGPDDARYEVGSLDQCQIALKTISDKHKLEPMDGPAVILIHGLLQSSRCMTSMAASFKDAGYTPIEFDYPSTQVTIPEAARYLDKLIKSLDGIDEINFVTHSMGGLVVRAWSLEYDDPRLRRMVMLGTPNQGAELADITHQYWILRTAAGPGARQLGTRPNGLIPKLPLPKCEFAVIAGSSGTPAGWNPLIPGDDDGTVTVESTKLPGAADFVTVRTLHSRLLWDEESRLHCVNFIRDGRLRLDAEPQPIPPADTSTAAKQ